MEASRNRDAEGLQMVENHDYPEVVPGQGYDTTPEAYSTIPQDYPKENKNTTHYFPNPAASPGEWSHRDQSPGPPQYFNSDRDETTKHLESQEKPRDRRICGMKRKVFVWVVIVAVIVVLAAVLGGVLGSVLGKHDDDKSSNSNSNSTTSSTSSPNALLDKTGLAMLSPAGQSSTFYYYIDQSGNIVENEFTNGVTQQNTTPDKITDVTALTAGANTPIAAISYKQQQNIVRQLFFFDKDGHVASTNTTGNETWSTPYVTVGNQSCLPNTMSLTAVADSNVNALNGIRVYFGSSAGFIQEIGMDFVDSVQNLWFTWNAFTGSSASSGVGGALVDGSSHVYFRNSSTGVLQQWTWRYADVNGDTRWTFGASSTSSNGVLDGGSVAVTSDGTNTDYIFYHDASGQAVQALYTGGNSVGAPNANVTALGQSPEGYSLAATWVDNTGAVVVNQPKGKTGLAFTTVGRNGDTKEWDKTT